MPASPAAPPPTRQTFPRRCRLLKSSEFDQVFRAGQRSADRYFTVLFCDNAAGAARLGFAIARQKIKLAVGRNRIRRIVRESYRRNRASLPSVDMVVLAREAAGSAKRPDIRASIERHWSNVVKARPKPYTAS